jgi:hypothetical protein
LTLFDDESLCFRQRDFFCTDNGLAIYWFEGMCIKPILIGLIFLFFFWFLYWQADTEAKKSPAKHIGFAGDPLTRMKTLVD